MSEDQRGLEAESRNQLHWLFHLKYKLRTMHSADLKRLVSLKQEETWGRMTSGKVVAHGHLAWYLGQKPEQRG